MIMDSLSKIETIEELQSVNPKEALKSAHIIIGANGMCGTYSKIGVSCFDVLDGKFNCSTLESAAGRAYTAYCAAVGGKAFNGDPLPDWETFRADPKKKLQSDAWVAAVKAI